MVENTGPIQVSDGTNEIKKYDVMEWSTTERKFVVCWYVEVTGGALTHRKVSCRVGQVADTGTTITLGSTVEVWSELTGKYSEIKAIELTRLKTTSAVDGDKATLCIGAVMTTPINGVYFDLICGIVSVGGTGLTTYQWATVLQN